MCAVSKFPPKCFWREITVLHQIAVQYTVQSVDYSSVKLLFSSLVSLQQVDV